MRSSFRALVCITGVLLAATGAAVAETDIRPQPGGKRLLFVDGDDIRPEPGGKRLLFIDGDTLRDQPGGKRLLFVDGDDIRPEPGGIRLALIDGNEIRRRPAGKILINVKHPDISPTAHDKRIYFIDGPQLSKPQLVAVLYVLKPELFKLSAAEEAEIRKEMAAAGAAAEREAKKDHVPGKYNIATASGMDADKEGGSAEVSARGEFYALKFDFKGGLVWTGMGVKVGEFLCSAFGPKDTMALAVYTIKGGNLDGKWYVPYADGTAQAPWGLEKLTGSPDLKGEYQITAGKSPKTGAAYGGKMLIEPRQETLNGEAKTYGVKWVLGDKTFSGLGMRCEDRFVVGLGAADFMAAQFSNEDGHLIGDWIDTQGKSGYYTMMK